jgi:hypothetical protein
VPLDQQVHQIADIRLDGRWEIGPSPLHKLGAIVKQGYSPAEWYGQPSQRLRYIAGAGNQKAWLGTEWLDKYLERRAAAAHALTAVWIQVIRGEHGLSAVQGEQGVRYRACVSRDSPKGAARPAIGMNQ